MFERCFVAIACEKGVAKYGSAMAFAKKIWPEKDEKNAAQKLYDILGKSNKTGKPQKLRLEEAVHIASLVDDNINFAQFCFEICEKLRLGWIEPVKDNSAKDKNIQPVMEKKSPAATSRNCANMEEDATIN